ncbi:hypothetical protein AADZ86_06845 [Colwelliaceae bacterium BS250]
MLHNKLRLLLSLLITLLLISCATQGRLEYITAAGEHKTACETEYTWQPSVDKYAVQYILSYCARKAKQEGHQVVDASLLEIDTNIPLPPNGQFWTVEYAQQLHRLNKLSDKQYGYIIGYTDLGLNKS